MINIIYICYYLDEEQDIAGFENKLLYVMKCKKKKKM